MTPELEPAEILFLLVSGGRGKPWPPDRYLGAIARAVYATSRAATLCEVLSLVLDELDAERDRYEQATEALEAFVLRTYRGEGVTIWNLRDDRHAAREAYEGRRALAREILETIDNWNDVARELVRVAAEAAEESPQRIMIDAGPREAHGGESTEGAKGT